MLGFLGPNGAGKSTTMKMLAGFLAPTSGSASVCGFDVEEQPLEAKRVLGYLPEGAPSYGEMTVREFLEFIADVRGLERRPSRRQRFDDVIGAAASGARARAADRDAVEGIQAPRRPRPGNPARSARC